MAEINIERKKTPVWRWLIILLLLALIGWAIYEFVLKKPADEDDTIYAPPTGLVIPAPNYLIVV